MRDRCFNGVKDGHVRQISNTFYGCECGRMVGRLKRSSQMSFKEMRSFITEISEVSRVCVYKCHFLDFHAREIPSCISIHLCALLFPQSKFDECSVAASSYCPTHLRASRVASSLSQLSSLILRTSRFPLPSHLPSPSFFIPR